MWKAFFIVSARSRTSLTRKLCLTIGRVMPTVSHSWKASRPIAGVGTWPVMITIGMRVHVGGGDAGHGIGHARARGDQRDADVAGGAGVAVGGVHRGLLVAHQHVLDGVLLVERVVDVQHRAARVAPEVLDVLGLQALDEDFGAVRLVRWEGAAAPMRRRLISAGEISMMNLCEFL